MTTDVREILFNFAQAAFHKSQNKLKKAVMSKETEAWMFNRFKEPAPLTLREVANLPANKQKQIAQLLTEYISFFSVFPHLSFAPHLTLGSSTKELGVPLLQYFQDIRWPLPRSVLH
ncbi:MAG: hypothetical protein ACRC3I_03705 [Cetobacterium sp.]